MKKGIFLILVTIYALPQSVFSQQISFKLINYTSENSPTTFIEMSMDPLGYIWMTSLRNGVFRYDGSEFVNYVHNDTIANSLSGDRGGCIYADSSGIIWIGTSGTGLDRYDPASKSFTHFRHDPRNPSSISNDTVTKIIEDHKGNLLLGTCGGFNIFNKTSQKFTHFTFDPKNPSSISYDRIRTIYQDRQGTIWIGCGDPISPVSRLYTNGGLNRFNPDNGSFTRFKHDPLNPASLASDVVGALFEDQKGNFWVGTMGDGLHIMDRKTGSFTHFYYDSTRPGNLSRPPVYVGFDYITFINEDVLGGLWVGSFFAGLNRYDPDTKKTTHFGLIRDSTHFLKNDTSEGFHSLNAWHMLITNDGMIWISTFIKQMYSVSLLNRKIPFFPTLRKGGANSFANIGDSITWIGTDSGLIRKNFKTNAELFYGPDSRNSNYNISGPIDIVRKDKENNLWLGTFKNGLVKFNPESGIFTRFSHDSKNDSSLQSDTVISMCIDHNDDIWVGTGNGLDKLDKKSGRFRHFFSNSVVFCIREDLTHDLWAGTNNELYRLNIESGKLTKFLNDAKVASICTDSKNGLWIGADTARIKEQNSVIYQTLYHLDRRKNQFVKFRDPITGNPITSLFDILEDGRQNLWISTTGAIFEITDIGNEVRKFDEKYGVHRNNFAVGDNFKAPDGRLFFGDRYGYYSFFPDDLKKNEGTRLNFSDFKLNGNKEAATEKILTEPIWKTKEISLAYDQNNFSIEFVGINYQKEGEIKYQVRLENYDDDWRENNTEKKALYFNVPPGRYIFHVRAYSGDGDFSEKSMAIVISPPWWKTWWANVLFILFAIGAIWGFIYYRSRKLRNENRMLEEKVTLRTNQLNQSVENLKSTQAQLIQSEKMASLGELTAGIAHEIQNPLNFVNNFAEINQELLEEMQEQIKNRNFEEVESMALDIIQNEKKIIHHGKRADSIVKGMLQHSRAQTGTREMTDLNALVDEYIRLSYHGIRAKDPNMNASLTTEFDPAIGKTDLVPQDIGRVLLNIFNNAFYSVTEKKKLQGETYQPVVSVFTKKIHNTAQITIKDNGTGIPKNIMDKVLQPFFTTKPTGSGTGLGLSLSYDIIKSHRGELIIDSIEGEGASFIITLPVH